MTEEAPPPVRERLQLDARQRAMLEAMGVPLQAWWPLPAAGAAPGVPPVQEPEPAPAPQRDPPAPAPVPVRDPPAPPAPSAPSAPTARSAPLADAVSPSTPTGTATATPSDLLADLPRRLYGEQGPVTGGWLVVADLAPDALGRHADAPLSGDEGRLLDNMLRALGLHAGAVPVHLVRVHRGSALPGDAAAPRPFGHAFAAERARLAPRLLLALGPLAAQALLGGAEPIGKLRGAVHALADGTPVLATYPLAHLLRQSAGKGKAWADLCLAADAFERAA